MRMAEFKEAVDPRRAGRAPDGEPRADWVAALRAYLLAAAVGNLAWETLQLPLYTIWTDGTRRQKAFAVLHCTGGDVLIALATLALALVIAGGPAWPARGGTRVAVLAIAFGVAYAIFSEWLNIVVRQSWAYADLMPVVPALGTGVSPLLQWILVPAAALRAARRAGVGPARSPRTARDAA